MPPIESTSRFQDIDYQDVVMSFLRFGWPPKITDNIRMIKVKKDLSGVLFDLWEDKVDQFMDYYQDLKGKGQDSGVEVVRCSALPELEEEDEGYGGGGSAWRNDYGGGNKYGGGGGRGGYQQHSYQK